MVFLLGTNFAETRLVKVALESFFGIGPNVSSRLMARFNIHSNARMSEVPPKQISDLTGVLSQMTIENDLKRKYLDNIRRLRDMGSYRGRRHAMSLPVRGQNTRSQIKTAKKLNRLARPL